MSLQSGEPDSNLHLRRGMPPPYPLDHPRAFSRTGGERRRFRSTHDGRGGGCPSQRRALPAAIVCAAIVPILATAPAEADRSGSHARCAVPFKRVATPPSLPAPSVVLRAAPMRPLVSGRSVEWRFTVRNVAGRPAGLVFRSAQYGDVTLSAPGRGIVYRWSDRRAFAQPILPTVLPPRSSSRCSLEPSALDVPPGRYLLRAHLNAYEPARPHRRISFRRYVVLAPPG